MKMYISLSSTTIQPRLSGQIRSATHPVHVTVHLPLDLLPSRPFVHEPEDLPVCPKGVGRFDACEPPPTLPSTLIYHPLKEGLEGAARDSFHHLGSILSCIFTITVKRVSLMIRRQIERMVCNAVTTCT